MMSDSELDELAADIKENGQREPITLTLENYDEAFDTETYIVVDGRNRYEACVRAGVAPMFSANLSIRTEQIGPWIISQNIHRRHLTTAQRAAVAVEYERIYAEQAKLREHERKTGTVENFPQSEPEFSDRSSEQAGDLFQVSGRSVRDAKFVSENDAEAFADVLAGKRSPSGAAKAIRAKRTPKPEPSPEDRAIKRAADICRHGEDFARDVFDQLDTLIDTNWPTQPRDPNEPLMDCQQGTLLFGTLDALRRGRFTRLRKTAQKALITIIEAELEQRPVGDVRDALVDYEGGNEVARLTPLSLPVWNESAWDDERINKSDRLVRMSEVMWDTLDGLEGTEGEMLTRIGQSIIDFVGDENKARGIARLMHSVIEFSSQYRSGQPRVGAA
ncbi:hypothetical protein ACT18_04585 [Mycolicibacter kumamotonensis]|uniref:Uncharacterized protein n=2 Tax=Mycolicibacter kumamotonensis TaxID=354243 RepID=A0A1B8SK57_9MYCO|nr:hypothetical protein ACT18_04585 [Mycolicibacter kumamotonensis]